MIFNLVKATPKFFGASCSSISPACTNLSMARLHPSSLLHSIYFHSYCREIVRSTAVRLAPLALYCFPLPSGFSLFYLLSSRIVSYPLSKSHLSVRSFLRPMNHINISQRTLLPCECPIPPSSSNVVRAYQAPSVLSLSPLSPISCGIQRLSLYYLPPIYSLPILAAPVSNAS